MRSSLRNSVGLHSKMKDLLSSGPQSVSKVISKSMYGSAVFRTRIQ